MAEDAWHAVGPEVAAALKDATKKVSAFIGKEQNAVIAGDDLTACFDIFRTLQGAEIWANHGDWIKHTQPNFGPGVRERFEWAVKVPAEDVTAAKKRR